MIEVSSKQVRPGSRAVATIFMEETVHAEDSPPVADWKHQLKDEFQSEVVREQLATGLAGIAWIHLFCFIGCHASHDPAIVTDLRHPLLWLTELVAILAYLRNSLGRGWIRSSAAINLVAKLWTTFLILSFNLVTLNSMTGFELAWYKPVWATLSTFLFATLAWLASPWLFIPAVQMWVTGLLMVQLPRYCFLIYGISWWIALTGISLWIRPRGPQQFTQRNVFMDR